MFDSVLRLLEPPNTRVCCCFCLLAQRRSGASFWSPPRGGSNSIAPSISQTNQSTTVKVPQQPALHIYPLFSFAFSSLYSAPIRQTTAYSRSITIHQFMSAPSAPSFMPLRGEPTAPTFERTSPSELLRFFYDLECLFPSAAITSDAEKKDETLYYVDFETEQDWKLITEYADATASYSDFKDAILNFYSVYSIRSLNLIISEAQRATIATTSHLAEYHRQFLTISSRLIRKEHIDSFDQRRSYTKAFHPPLFLAINQRLQGEYPDHQIDVPYQVLDVYDAAQFVLQSPSQRAPLAGSPQPSACSTVEITSSHPHFSDSTRKDIVATNITPYIIASTVYQSSEPLHYLQDGRISPGMQSTRNTPLHDRINLEFQCGPQRPLAMPSAPSISTSQPTVSQGMAHSCKASILVRPQLEPLSPSSTVFKSSSITEIEECGLDTPITLTQDQLSAFSPDTLTKILDFIAARQPTAPSTPQTIPVAASQQFRHSFATTLEAELPMPRLRKENIAPVVSASAKEERGASSTSEPAIPECPVTVYNTSLPRYKGPHTEIIEPESAIIRTLHIKGYTTSLQPAPVSKGQINECVAISVDLESVPFASSFSSSPATAACGVKSVFSPSTSPPSINTCIVIYTPPLALADKGSPQHTIDKESLAFSPGNLNQLACISYPSAFSVSSSSSMYIAVSNLFLHLALKRIPRHSIPLDIIAYPPCQAFGPAYFNTLVNSTFASAIMTFLDLFSAVRITAAASAPSFTTPACISRLSQSALPATIVNCSVLSKRAIDGYYTHLFVFLHFSNCVAPLRSSMRVLLHLLHGREALAWTTSDIFALGHIFDSKASLRPRKPDKQLLDSGHTFPGTMRRVGSFGNRPTALVYFMTRDSHY